MIFLLCKYEPRHYHEYPEDWEFGGANNEDPRSDSRWVSRQYEYYDASLHVIATLASAICDDEAIDKFTLVGQIGPFFSPVYIARRLGGERKYEFLPWQYDKTTDTVVPL